MLQLLAILTSVYSLPAILQLKEGARCRGGNPAWTCKLYTDCPAFQDAIMKKQYPKICSFETRNKPVVCCPVADRKASDDKSAGYPQWSEMASWNSFYQTDAFIWGDIISTSTDNNLKATKSHQLQSKSKAMCLKYAKHIWKTIPSLMGLQNDESRAFCGRTVETLISDGQPAGPREFPHMARIGYGVRDGIEWLCGGSLISERFILSAAHCTDLGNDRTPNWANLGDLDTSTEKDDAQPVTIRIIDRINHPEYNPYEKYHDIAVYKLESDAPLGIYIRPICLNTEKTIGVSTAIASGWGHTSWGGYESSKLLKVKLNVVSSERCNSTYQPNIGVGMDLPQGIVADYMVCAGGQGEKDTCQGDSGGPLQIALDTPYCMYSLVGVTAFGKRCGYGFPAVYTNVANYLSWIEQIVWP